LIVSGICPECDFLFKVEDVTVGETLACPECALTLQVRDIKGTELELEMIESDLPDWGE
jgi:alpha-aminoadipate carrier protein LysW